MADAAASVAEVDTQHFRQLQSSQRTVKQCVPGALLAAEVAVACCSTAVASTAACYASWRLGARPRDMADLAATVALSTASTCTRAAAKGVESAWRSGSVGAVARLYIQSKKMTKRKRRQHNTCKVSS